MPTDASHMVNYTLPALELEPQDVFTSSLRADKPWTLCTKKHYNNILM
jgi:hypothetical protein